MGRHNKSGKISGNGGGSAVVSGSGKSGSLTMNGRASGDASTSASESSSRERDARGSPVPIREVGEVGAGAGDGTGDDDLAGGGIKTGDLLGEGGFDPELEEPEFAQAQAEAETEALNEIHHHANAAATRVGVGGRGRSVEVNFQGKGNGDGSESGKIKKPPAPIPTAKNGIKNGNGDGLVAGYQAGKAGNGNRNGGGWDGSEGSDADDDDEGDDMEGLGWGDGGRSGRTRGRRGVPVQFKPPQPNLLSALPSSLSPLPLPLHLPLHLPLQLRIPESVKHFNSQISAVAASAGGSASASGAGGGWGRWLNGDRVEKGEKGSAGDGVSNGNGNGHGIGDTNGRAVEVASTKSPRTKRQAAREVETDLPQYSPPKEATFPFQSHSPSLTAAPNANGHAKHARYEEPDSDDDLDYEEFDFLDGGSLVAGNGIGSGGGSGRRTSGGIPVSANGGEGDLTGGRCHLRYQRFKFAEVDSRTLLIGINPSPDTSLEIWDVSQGSSAVMRDISGGGIGGVGDMSASVVEEERAPREVMRLGRGGSGEGEGEERWVLDGAVRKGEGRLELVQIILEALVNRPSSSLNGSTNAIAEGGIVLQVLDMHTGEVEQQKRIGRGRQGSIEISDKAVAVALAGSSPSIHFFHPQTLEPLCAALTKDIGVNTRTGIPVISLKHRLLAYSTTAAAHARPDWQTRMEEPKHGDIVTARSVKMAYESRNSPPSPPAIGSYHSPESLPSLQAMVVNTATGISTEVAKGVWSGLKGLGMAAVNGASKSSTLSKSAPTVSEFAKRLGGEHNGNGVNGIRRPPSKRKARFDGGSWVKVVDLGSLVASRSTSSRDADPSAKLKAKLVAHFALPFSEPMPVHSSASLPKADLLSFSPLGTHLAIGTADGRSVAIAEVRPGDRISKPEGYSHGQIWLRREFRRGVTPARLVEISWDRSGNWVTVTSRKTTHVFQVDLGNPKLLQSTSGITKQNQRGLSVKVQSQARLRLADWISSTPDNESPKLGPLSTPTLRLSASSLSPSVPFAAVAFDPSQRLFGLCLGVTPQVKGSGQHAVVGIVQSAWRLASTGGKRQPDLLLPENSHAGRARRRVHSQPFSQIEVNTFSTSDVIPTIYRDKAIHFTTWTGTIEQEKALIFRTPVTASSLDSPNEFEDSLHTALHHDIERRSSSPIIPALPNGNNNKHRWHSPPINVISSAKVITHIRRPHRRNKTETSTEYSEHLGYDDESGFVVNLQEEVLGAVSPGLTDRDEDVWEEDLIAGVMDD